MLVEQSLPLPPYFLADADHLWRLPLFLFGSLFSLHYDLLGRVTSSTRRSTRAQRLCFFCSWPQTSRSTYEPKAHEERQVCMAVRAPTGMLGPRIYASY